MADILDAAQTTTPATVDPVVEPPTPAEPIPPTPQPVSVPPVAPNTESLIVPPPDSPAPTPIAEPPQEKPKKKSRLGVLLAGLLLLVITLPVLTIFVKQQVEIRSRAAGTFLRCEGTPPAGCTVYGFSIQTCGNRDEANCKAVATCSDGRSSNCKPVYSGTTPPPTSGTTPSPTPCTAPNQCIQFSTCDASGTIVPGKCTTSGFVCCKVTYPTTTPTNPPTGSCTTTGCPPGQTCSIGGNITNPTYSCVPTSSSSCASLTKITCSNGCEPICAPGSGTTGAHYSCPTSCTSYPPPTNTPTLIPCNYCSGSNICTATTLPGCSHTVDRCVNLGALCGPNNTPSPTPKIINCASGTTCRWKGCYAGENDTGNICTNTYGEQGVCCALNPTPTPKIINCASGTTCRWKGCYAGENDTGNICTNTYGEQGVCCALNSTPTPGTTPGTTPPPGTCNLPPNGYICPNTGAPFEGQCAIYHCPQGCGGGNTTKCDEEDPGVWISHGPCSTRLAANECGQIDIVDKNLTYCNTLQYCTVPQIRCTNCTANIVPTPTPGQCVSIIAYKDGNALSASELSALHPGDTIILAFAPGGAATKVSFRVNSSNVADWKETTTKNSNGQFTWDYTLANVSTFTIEARWFDGTNWH